MNNLPVLPLRDIVIYPSMQVPLFIGRQQSTNTINLSFNHDKLIVLVTQKKNSEYYPEANHLYDVGVLAKIIKISQLPDKATKIIVETTARVKVNEIYTDNDILMSGPYSILEEKLIDEEKKKVYSNILLKKINMVAELNDNLIAEKLLLLQDVNDLGHLIDAIAASLPITTDQKQSILALSDQEKRFESILIIINAEIEFLKIDKKIDKRVHNQLGLNQKNYYLNEKIKAIRTEIDGKSPIDDTEKLTQKAAKVNLSKEAATLVAEEIKKLAMLSVTSSEYSVIRNHIDYILGLPWKTYSKEHYNLRQAKEDLDKKHYGLNEAKERILEYLSVQKRVNHNKTPILCLVGPPGVGKTSLGESIAKSINRKFVRISLGGVSDEAEIRGHRRTYVGAMPGKIIQKIKKIGVDNPLFVLDEIDKLRTDYKGDPAAALLEVLDPEQNNTFNDNYLEVDYDLSKIMFICTANTLDIPSPLLDRMETIRIPGYTYVEKINIAKNHLINNQIKLHGLSKKDCSFSPDAIKNIITHYTNESGVRELERQIAKICRKMVRQQEEAGEIQGKNHKFTKTHITVNKLKKYLGVAKYSEMDIAKENSIGEVTGLAWTKVGGTRLAIESQVLAGKGKQQYTGSLGDVMKESIQTALTVIKARSSMLGIKNNFYAEHDFHIHMPDGATPKDGPSAGIAICTALASSITKIPVKSDVAMTGEITLSGKVLPIGGLKEKLLAAHRGGIKTVIIPKKNSHSVTEIDPDIIGKLTIKYVETIEEVLSISLQSQPNTVQ